MLKKIMILLALVNSGVSVQASFANILENVRQKVREYPLVVAGMAVAGFAGIAYMVHREQKLNKRNNDMERLVANNKGLVEEKAALERSLRASRKEVRGIKYSSKAILLRKNKTLKQQVADLESAYAMLIAQNERLKARHGVVKGGGKLQVRFSDGTSPERV